MKARQFGLQLAAALAAFAGLNAAVALAAFAGLNAAVARLAWNSTPRQVVRHAIAAEPAGLVALGNSTMAAGFSEATAAGEGVAGLNAAVGATAPVEHLAILRAIRARHPAARVVYGVFDAQLTDAPSGRFAELFGNRAVVYELAPDLAALYYGDTLAWRLAIPVVARVPVLTERAALWGRVEALRRKLGAVGTSAPAESNRFGRAADFTLLEADPMPFRATLREVVARGAPLGGPVTELLRLAAEPPAPSPVVVAVPMPGAHRAAYYDTPEYRAYTGHVRQQLAELGAGWVPAEDWVADDGFADALHLNDAGAATFTRRLVRTLAEDAR